MNWDQIQGKWKQSAGRIKEKWGKLTDDDLATINGKREQLVGLIQERYGIAKEAAEKQVDEFTSSYRSGDTAAKSAKSSR
ncbi:MAG TPA: CsbD family protein [Candidatus Acidoferrum sp.]|nr:CsbD family protein [Candidatus Acidoferrum sp.]